MTKKALLAILIALLIPIVLFRILTKASENAINMPGRFYPDTVITHMKDGKQLTDTVWHAVSDIRLTNQLGRTVSLRDDTKGKVIVLDFFFTRCPSICPYLTANMRKLQDALLTKDRFKELNPAFVQFISLSVDPERDSVPVLRAYGNRFGVDPDMWWLLTGPKKEIYDFALNELKMGLVDGEGVDSNFIHTQKMVLLDKSHVVRGYYNGLDSVDLRKLADDIVFIMLEKDKDYVSPLTELKPLMPMILFIVLATGAVVYFLFRTPKYPVKKKET
ncbi:MAG: SCO family protein [Bacteroidota bacterium]|nr:SCO family protein [Bacteroidota bacterium]MDP4212549.1 SCO family protein [Bacteroidota bacterium]MDP4249856.1 SCO family protein [Bacteroidota bacterium]